MRTCTIESLVVHNHHRGKETATAAATDGGEAAASGDETVLSSAYERYRPSRARDVGDAVKRGR